MFNNDQAFPFKQFFVPLTTVKAINIIAIVGILVFFNCLFNDFIFDDKKYIIFNPSIQTINLYDSFFSTSNIFNAVVGGQYRPLPAFISSLLYAVFTTTPFFYHLFQLLLHIANTVLLFFLFKHFFHKTLSLFLSLVFLVHPLQVEAVAWFAAFDNTMFFFFGISALLLSLKRHVTWKRMIALFCLLLLSLFTKETGLIFMFLVLLYRMLFSKRQRIFFLIGAACTLAVYAFIRFVLVGIYFVPFYIPAIAVVPVGVRLLTIPAVLFYYLKNFVYPSDLGFQQNWVIRSRDFSHFFFPSFVDLLFFMCLLFLGWLIVRANNIKFPVYLFFLVWFVVGLLFHSQLFALDMTVADRWMYLPIVGLLGIVGSSIQAMKFTTNNKRVVGITVAILLVCLLSVRTMVRNTNWSDEVTIVSHDIHTYDDFTVQEGWFGHIK